jgi:hypothetical protein
MDMVGKRRNVKKSKRQKVETSKRQEAGTGNEIRLRLRLRRDGHAETSGKLRVEN